MFSGLEVHDTYTTQGDVLLKAYTANPTSHPSRSADGEYLVVMIETRASEGPPTARAAQAEDQHLRRSRPRRSAGQEYPETISRPARIHQNCPERRQPTQRPSPGRADACYRLRDPLHPRRPEQGRRPLTTPGNSQRTAAAPMPPGRVARPNLYISNVGFECTLMRSDGSRRLRGKCFTAWPPSRRRSRRRSARPRTHFRAPATTGIGLTVTSLVASQKTMPLTCGKTPA
jgi:hypothetical protein